MEGVSPSAKSSLSPKIEKLQVYSNAVRLLLLGSEWRTEATSAIPYGSAADSCKASRANSAPCSLGSSSESVVSLAIVTVASHSDRVDNDHVPPVSCPSHLSSAALVRAITHFRIQLPSELATPSSSLINDSCSSVAAILSLESSEHLSLYRSMRCLSSPPRLPFEECSPHALKK